MREHWELTASHIRSRHIRQRIRCLLNVVAHAYSSTIALVNTVDEKVGKSGVSVSEVDSASCHKEDLDLREVHLERGLG